jgi:hypothetical protein
VVLLIDDKVLVNSESALFFDNEVVAYLFFSQADDIGLLGVNLLF